MTALHWFTDPAHIALFLLALSAALGAAFPDSAIARRIAGISYSLGSVLKLGRKRPPHPPTPSPAPKPMFIVLVNHSPAARQAADLTPEWLDRVAAAITKDLQTSFCPEYGLGPWSVTTDTSVHAPHLVLLNDSDVAGALGYHAVGPNGLPYGDVFTDHEAQADIEETVSHEIKEMIGDLWANDYSLSERTGIAFAKEACDAVQGSAYTVDGVRMANHVTQAWYVDGSKGPWDKGGVLNGAHERTNEGYVIRLVNGTVDTDPPEAKGRYKAKRANSRTRRRVARRFK